MSASLLVAVLASACNGLQQATVPPATPLGYPPAPYYDTLWFADDLAIVTELRPSGGPVSADAGVLIGAHISEALLEELPVAPVEKDCAIADSQAPTKLPDGRLGFIRYCHDPMHWQLFAFDGDTKTSEILADLGDPAIFGRHEGVWSFTYRSAMRDPLVHMGTWICDGVAAVRDHEVGPFSLTLDLNGVSVDLADYFSRPCIDTANVRGPAWDPDGGRLALLVATGARGQDGAARLEAPYDLVVYNLIDKSATDLASDLRSPTDPRWSPDGQWIVVTTEPAAVGSYRTWLIDASGKTPAVQLPLDAAARPLAWAPDGHRLVMLVRTSSGELFPPLSRIEIVDVSPYLVAPE